MQHAASWSFDTPLHPQVMTPRNVMESECTMKLSVALTLLSIPQVMIPLNAVESGVFLAVSWSFDTPLHLQVMTPPNVTESEVSFLEF